MSEKALRISSLDAPSTFANYPDGVERAMQAAELLQAGLKYVATVEEVGDGMPQAGSD